MKEVHNLNLSMVIKRLEMIKSLISLEEEDEISTHISILQQLPLPTELESIITCLKEQSYSTAVSAIEQFINQHQSLSIYFDPAVDALKLEIKSQETTINFLSGEIADLEKLIHEFGVRHNKELGELLIKILQFRKENAKGTSQQREAEDDYNTYHQEYESTKNEKVATLTDAEKGELKDKYRKASKLCHPDVVSEEQKEFATKLFSDLSAAYEQNDIKQVKEILENLEKGHFFVNKSDAINEKELLQAERKKQVLKIEELKEQLRVIRESDTYKTISNIENWDEYFAVAKQKLKSQLENLTDGK